jgi:myo-inositol-1(or 4)-monophosphatase
MERGFRLRKRLESPHVKPRGKAAQHFSRFRTTANMNKEFLTLLKLAKQAAAAGAAVHRQAIETGRFSIDTKASAADLVTEIDRAAEQQIVSVIRAARPNDGILGEEGTNEAGSTGVRWILDPLDGTTNFVHRYPAHAVAVGVELDGRRALGVVQDTFNQCVYAGIVGQGATCDGQPIAVRQEQRLAQSLVGTGFLPIVAVRRKQAEVLGEILPLVRDIRRSGCPSLDICQVAAGALDAFYEFGLGPWDIAPAAAIAEAAGATVHLLYSDILPNPLLIVANADLAAALIAPLAEAKIIS